MLYCKLCDECHREDGCQIYYSEYEKERSSKLRRVCPRYRTLKKQLKEDNIKIKNDSSDPENEEKSSSSSESSSSSSSKKK